MFNPSRLDLARRRRGQSWSVLADLVDLDRRTLHNYTTGETTPTDDVLLRLSVALEFPVAFFGGPDLDVPTDESASFRAQSKMRAGQRDMALAEGALALALNTWMEDRFDLPKLSVDAIETATGAGSPEAAAISLRHKWGLGEVPISHMIGLLEAQGVRVYSLSVEAQEVDAFSLWHEDRAFVFLNTQKTSERSRFDAAHELGHLILHRHAAPNGRAAEEEAHKFAAEFLMPAGSVRAHAPRFPTIPSLVQLKAVWNVSLAALIHRLHDLRLINSWHYRQLNIELGKQGYRTGEPVSAPRESSRALTQIFSLLREDGRGKASIVQDLAISEEEIDRLTFGLVVTSMRGGRAKAAPSRPESDQLQLRLVK